MAYKTNAAAKNLIVDAVTAVIGFGLVSVYTGSEPTSAADAATGTKLLEWDLSASSGFSAASAGSATLAGTPYTATGLADGTAGYFRFTGGTPTSVLQGSVSATGGGGILQLSSTTVSTGQQVDITSCSLTVSA